jgi:hypothetical protein
MRHLPAALLLIPLLAASALGEPEHFDAVSEDALHFRVEIGREPGHVVHVVLDESAGIRTGYDTALLDQDGDGTFEGRQTFEEKKDYRDNTFRDAKISFTHDDATWALELISFKYSRPAMKDGTLTTSVRWSVTREDFHVWFINGRTTFAADVERAGTVRMGPPFHFEASAATKGPKALALVGLKDQNGCTLRLARGEGNRQLRPEIRLLAGGEEKFKAYASYG